MRRTVINTLSLMVLFSSFVFAETGKKAELQKPIKSFNGLTKAIRTHIPVNRSEDFTISLIDTEGKTIPKIRRQEAKIQAPSQRTVVHPNITPETRKTPIPDPEKTIGEYTLEELEGLPTEALKKLYEKTEDFRTLNMITSRWHPSVSESAGSRTLDTESEPNDDYTTANAITDSMAAAIDPGGDEDYFSFTAVDGAEYTFETQGLSGSSNNVSDTKLYLYDTDGSTQLSYNDDGGTGYYSLIAYTITTDGTYYVKVTGYTSSYTGDYLLTMTSAAPQVDPYEPNNTLATATAIASGDSLVGPMIDPGGDVDLYVFTGTAGYFVSAQTDPVDGVTMDTKLYLLGSDSTQLAFNDDGGEGFLSWISGYELPANGTYYLKATGYSSTTTGSYNMELDLIAPSAYAGVIIVNEIMQNPSAVSDSYGEYVELVNLGATDVDVEGWTLADADYDGFVIHGDTTGYGYGGGGGTTLIAAGGYLVLGISADQAINGGALVDYEYGSYGNPDAYSLANGSDEVILYDANGSTVDIVEYDNGSTFPDPTGLSMEFHPDSLAAGADNNDGTNWQEAWTTFGDGDYGTPGAANSVEPTFILDNYEPNDNSAASAHLAPGTYNLTLSATEDVYDWFWYPVGAGDTVEVQIAFDTSNDFDLYIYDQLGSMLDYSLFDNPEVVDNVFATDDTLYILAHAYSGAGDYTMTFTVASPPITSPWADGFEDGAAGWTIVDNDASGYSWAVSTFGGNAYEGTYYMSCGYNSAGNDDWLITPDMTITDNDIFSFYITNNSSFYQEEVEVWMSTTAGTSPSDFDVRLDSLSIQLYYVYEQKSYDVSAYAGQTVTFALRSIGVDQYYTYADYFELSAAPANPIIAINYTGANHGAIVVGDTASFGDVFTVTNDGGGTMTITSVTNLTGTDYITTFDASISLAAGESHSFGFSYIPSDIGVDNVTFTVSSNGGDADIALSGASYGTDYVNEGFEGGVPPAGWEANIVSGTYNWEQSSYWGSFDPGGTGSYTALYNTFNASTGSSAEMITPRLDFTGSASNILSFLYVGTGDLLNIDISDDGGTTWYDVADITDHTNYYVIPYTYDLSAYTGNNVIIKFTALSAYQYRMAMDEVKFPSVYVPPSAPIYISEIVVTPTAGEFVEIFNPNASDVELSNYYLTDATYAGGGSYYYNIVTGSDYGGGSFGDFHARFPDGAIIAAGNYQTIALAGSDGFNAEYGIAPDYELYEDATAADSIPDMREAVTGSIGGQGGLTNGDEVVVLYFWDGLTDLVKDSDYLLWDNGGEVPNEAVDKTGISVDGPDTDSDASAYLDDTPIADQHFGPSPGYGFSLHRIDYGEGSETSTGGNGIDGHDETSENTDTTFAISLPTPGGAAQLDFFEPNNSFATAVSVSVPDTLTGMAINPVGDLDWFSFSADRWSKVTIDMFINGYSSLDGEIALFDEDSTKLVSADVGYSGGDEQIADFEILTTGTYYIVAGYWGDVRANTGDYALGVAVTPAPYTGFVAGMVSDSETGLVIDSTAVISVYGVVYSGADGAYIFEAPIGLLDVSFTKDGYNSVFFTVSVDSGDTVDLNVVLTPEVVDNLYSTGFETGDDTGTSTVYSGWDFAVLDSMFNADGDTVLPDAGVYMLAYPDTAGVTYNNNDLVVWLSDSVIDISSFSSLQLSLDAIYDTENNWDYFFVGLLLDDGFIYYGSGGAITGSSTGWEELNLDVSWAIGASTTATPAIWFDSDGSVNSYWGGAFDNITLTGNEFFLAPPTDLMAENYGASVPLSWDEPASAGRVSYGLQRVDLANIHTLTRPMVIDENGQMIELVKGPRDYEQVTVDYQYNTTSSRSLSHYNVFRADWPFGGYALLDTSTTNSYNDADVTDGDYVDYYVTAVYDEGETVSSNVVSALAGLPLVFTDDAFGGEDFEDGFDFVNWEQFNSTDEAEWVVGDSASADSAFGIGSSVIPAPDHTNFAYISDGRAGDDDFESILISPFLDFVDNHTAIVSLAGYAQVWGNFAGNNEALLVVRADMGEWHDVLNFGYDHNSGWGDYKAQIGHIVGGSDYVQLAIVYTHVGGLNSGFGNGIAVDDLSLDIISGPHDLVLSPTINDVGLSWAHPDSTMNLLRDPVGPAESRQAAFEANPEEMLNLSNERTTCYSHGSTNSGWITGFFGPDSVDGDVAPTFAALHTFNEGAMELDEVVIHGYYNTDDTTTARADIFVGVADLTGATTDTIATGISLFDISATGSWTEAVLDLTGLTYNATDSTYLKITWTPLDYAYVALFGAQLWIPGQQIDDPNTIPANGLSGYDSAGVFTPSSTYNFVMEVCGTPTPPAISYNVYKDGIVVIDGLEETTWTDDNVSVVTEYCYWVTGIVPMSFNLGDEIILDELVETEPTNVECGRAINQPPGDFTLLTPNDGDTVMISLDNIGGNQLFAWNASVDPNGTPVEYEICWNIVAPFDQFCDVGITSTAQFVPLQDIVDYIDSLQQAGYGYTVDITWQVYASDGMDETEAGNGPRTITFDAGYALGVGDELGVPDVFALHQNYPNPFNPVTTIRFDIPHESHVLMDVYNVLGQRVRTLMNGTMQPGFHAVRWDGTNDMGKPLASGMYIYRIQSSKFTSVKKLVLMK